MWLEIQLVKTLSTPFLIDRFSLLIMFNSGQNSGCLFVGYLLGVNFVELHFKQADLIKGLEFAYYWSLLLSIGIKSELVAQPVEQRGLIQPLGPGFLSSGSVIFL